MHPITLIDIVSSAAARSPVDSAKETNPHVAYATCGFVSVHAAAGTVIHEGEVDLVVALDWPPLVVIGVALNARIMRICSKQRANVGLCMRVPRS